jgi:outer membrane protein assembly factor BamD (BamD/ComL family)
LRPKAPDLVAEVEALDEARRALSSDPEAALAAIDAYHSRFEGGALGHEATVLRIEALVRAGQSERARAAGAAFLARHPSSPLAQRVRNLLASLATNDE